jgi:hypothetical protein
MRRYADLHSGLERLRLLVDALESLPVDSPGRESDVQRLLADLGDGGSAKLAEALAAHANDRALRYRLLLRQADLSGTSKTAAGLYWQVAEAGCLPDEKLAYACSVLNYCGQSYRVIRIVEDRLRRGGKLPLGVLAELRQAYLFAGRPVDAQRADRQDPEPAPPTPPPTMAPPPTWRAGMPGGFF